MKILHLISGGDIGGAKTHVLTLLSKINSCHTAQLLCVLEGSFTADARLLGIPTTVIAQNNRLDISAILLMGKFINSGGFDIVHCHGARANFFAVFLRFIVKAPMLTTVHSDYRLDFKDSKYKQLIFMPLNAFALRRFNYFLAVTDVFKKMMMSRGFMADKIRVVYNGVDFNKDIIKESPDVFLKRFGLVYNTDFVYIGTASRLHPVKGVNYLLEAASVITSRYHNVVFLIAGDGSEFHRYKEYINSNNLSECVHLLGHVNDIESFYNVLDINTLSSISESFPYSLLEGARQKKATVASAVGGVIEMIENGKTGFLFDDVSQMIEYLCLLIDNAQLRSSIGEAFYKAACDKFSVDTMVKTHLEYYDFILKESKQ